MRWLDQFVTHLPETSWARVQGELTPSKKAAPRSRFMVFGAGGERNRNWERYNKFRCGHKRFHRHHCVFEDVCDLAIVNKTQGWKVMREPELTDDEQRGTL